MPMFVFKSPKGSLLAADAKRAVGVGDYPGDFLRLLKLQEIPEELLKPEEIALVPWDEMAYIEALENADFSVELMGTAPKTRIQINMRDRGEQQRFLKFVEAQTPLETTERRATLMQVASGHFMNMGWVAVVALLLAWSATTDMSADSGRHALLKAVLIPILQRLGPVGVLALGCGIVAAVGVLAFFEYQNRWRILVLRPKPDVPA